MNYIAVEDSIDTFITVHATIASYLSIYCNICLTAILVGST